jgi:hypothetical protein
MRSKPLVFSPCSQTFGRLMSCAVALSNCAAHSAATITCFGETMSMQWASRMSAQLGIDQRNDNARAGEAEPYRQIFGPVRHHQADRFVLGQPLIERPTRETVGACDERPIGSGSRRRPPLSTPAHRPAPRRVPRSRGRAGVVDLRRPAPCLQAHGPSRAARCRSLAPSASPVPLRSSSSDSLRRTK